MRTLFVVWLTCFVSYGADSLVLLNITIVDGAGKPPFSGNVIIQGERITHVAANAPIPAGAEVVDGRGLTVLPGLFDLHTHLPYSSVTGARSDWPKNLAAYLLSGVTTVAEFGAYGETFAPMRELLTSGVVAGPHILFASRLTTPGGHGAEGGRPDIFSLEVITPREARAAVRQVLSYKPDVIKVFTDGWRYGTAPDMSSMEEATLCALVDEAHKSALKVLTHTVTLDKAKIAARCKVDVIAHSIGDKEADEELLRLMKQNGVGYVATLAVYEPRPRDTKTPLLERVLEPLAFARLGPAGPMRGPAATRRWQVMTHNAGALQKAGIVIGCGTDAGVTGTHHGWAAVRELKLLVESGFTPLEAIRAGTMQSATLAGLEADRGAVAAGKRADLVLVAGKPWERIEDLENVEAVILNGRKVDLARLRAMVASDAMSPIPAKSVPAKIDDFEQPAGLSTLGTRWVNGSDSGHDRSRMMFTRTLRKNGNHSVSLIGRMAEKDNPFLRLLLPLHPGGIVPADLSKYKGVRFAARGEGAYRFLAIPRASGTAVAAFNARGSWKTIRIPFDSMKGVNKRDVLMLGFESARPPREETWLEIDDLRFY